MRIEISGNISLKYLKISNFMEIRPVGAELLHADRWKDKTGRHDEANSGFSHFRDGA
jgi:hypothetical protein